MPRRNQAQYYEDHKGEMAESRRQQRNRVMLYCQICKTVMEGSRVAHMHTRVLGHKIVVKKARK